MIQQSQVPISFLESRPGDRMLRAYGMDLVAKNRNLGLNAFEKKLFEDVNDCFGFSD